MVGRQERQLGLLRLMELDRHLVLSGKAAGRAELGDVVIHRDHAGAAFGETHSGMALTTTQIEDAASGDLADQSPFDISTDARTEVHDVQRRIGDGKARIVQRHGSSLAA